MTEVRSWPTMALYSLIGALLLLGVLGVGLAAAMPGMDRWHRGYFMAFFATLVASMAATLAEIYVYNDPATLDALRAAGLLGSLLPSILLVMPTVYLLHCCGQPCRGSTLMRCVLAAWAAYLAMLAMAQFTTLVYYYTPEGVAEYGPWYPMMLLPLDAIVAMNLVGVIRRRDLLSGRLFISFLTCLVPLMVALPAYLLLGAYLLLDLGVAASALSMFVAAVSEQVEQHLRLQREAARQRASIAVLRMRPHFIHNTMTSIYYLCDQDPKCAKQLTLDFNTYLRKNFDAIAEDGLVPVTDELEHTRAYLAVEQAQYQTKLAIHYDTPHTGFLVPPLTIEPLAENAVKHGMSPKSVPLHVSIRTLETPSASVVVVEDDGAGFDVGGDERP